MIQYGVTYGIEFDLDGKYVIGQSEIGLPITPAQIGTVFKGSRMVYEFHYVIILL
jgi:hypothetical protein